jgi:peptidyl-prolyl cis-trans isomerase SurA
MTRHASTQFLIAFFLAGTVSFSNSVATQPSVPVVKDMDRVIAVVNDDVITESELERRLAQTKKQLTLEKINIPPDASLRKQLLERMIVERLQLQLAARLGIRSSEEDVERAVKSIAARNKMDVEAFTKTLTDQGFELSEFRGQLRDQVTIQQLLEREINNRVTVGDAEVDNLIEQKGPASVADTEYNLSHIFIAIPETASPEQIQAAKDRAEQVHREIESSGDFERLAVTYSQSPEALSGGQIGWRKAGQLPDLFVEALLKLEPGNFSGVLRGPNGFHIVKLNERRGEAGTESVVQTHVRHILMRQSEIQSLAEARTKLLQLRVRIEQGEDFAVLARAHSEDTVSAAGGGDLGWMNPGQLVPAFESAMGRLNPGELSAPVETPFGLHLIQVLERRTQDVSQDRLRAAARRQIHARKADQRYEQWVRQLRDEAYVEYLLEDVN